MGKEKKMKNTFKKLTLVSISGIMLAATVLPAFAKAPVVYKSSSKPAYQQSYQYQNQGYQQNNYSLAPLHGRVVTVPPGTMVSGAAPTRDLSSKNMRTGDSVNLIMNTPFYYAGSMVLPPGTSIIGTVVTAKAAGFTGANGQLMIVFNQAITPNGQRIGLTGKIATEDGSGLLKGGTGSSRALGVAKDAAVGAGAGALLGTIFGAVSGGKIGRGAALGTAIGGGTGLAKSAIDKGADVVIEAGTPVDIILDSELRAGADDNAPQQNYNYGY